MASPRTPLWRRTDDNISEDQEDKTSVEAIRRAYALKREGETDPITLTRRQKQIDYGKATQGYQNYLRRYPKETRTSRQPGTPNKYQVCSRRAWDGQIKIWRLLLHAYDDDRGTSSSEANRANEETTTRQASDSNNNSDYLLVDRNTSEQHQTYTKSR